MNKNKYLLGACIFLLLAGGLYYFLREEPAAPAKINQEAKSNSAANITFSGNTIVEQSNGHKIWEITAEGVQVDPNTNIAKLVNFKGKLYRSDGSRIDIAGKQAFFDAKTRNISIEGGVTAKATDGAEFKAAKINWSSKDQHISGSGGIVYTKGDVVITGDKIDSDSKMEKVKVAGNAHIVKGGISQ